MNLNLRCINLKVRLETVFDHAISPSEYLAIGVPDIEKLASDIELIPHLKSFTFSKKYQYSKGQIVLIMMFSSYGKNTS